MHDDRVLILPDSDKQQTESGIIIPIGAQRPPAKLGVIVNVGELVVSRKVNERVLIMAQSGLDIEHEGKTYKILRESDLLATIE